MTSRLYDLASLAATTALVASAVACSSDDGGSNNVVPPGNNPPVNSTAGTSSMGTAGTAPVANAGGGNVPGGGAQGMAGSGAAGDTSMPGAGGAGQGGDSSQAGAGGAAAGGDTGAAGAAGADSTGWMGYEGIEDLSVQKPTAGCGQPPEIGTGDWEPYETMVPIPDNHDGFGGDGVREYYVRLPPNYDPNTVYKVVVGGSSCVNQQNNPAPININSVTDATGGVIQISPIVEPDVMAEGSYVCYDDKDTNSIEYGLMETMLQEVGEKFCFDQHKVFVLGHSSGGWYSNMMGCVFGSTLLRAMSSNGGGIAQGDGETPPCSENPIPGMWLLPKGDMEGRRETQIALNHALRVNKCEGADGNEPWETVATEPYSEGGAGGQDCVKYACPEAFPVIFCEPDGGHGLKGFHPEAAWTFFNSLP